MFRFCGMISKYFQMNNFNDEFLKIFTNFIYDIFRIISPKWNKYEEKHPDKQWYPQLASHDPAHEPTPINTLRQLRKSNVHIIPATHPCRGHSLFTRGTSAFSRNTTDRRSLADPTVLTRQHPKATWDSWPIPHLQARCSCCDRTPRECAVAASDGFSADLRNFFWRIGIFFAD